MLIFIVMTVVVLVLAYLLLISPADTEMGEGEMLWSCHYAHRGLHNKEKSIPENSMAAFAAAVKQGYGIELDIHLTADDRIVVFHDDTLTRMCGVDRAIEDCTYEELHRYTLLDTTEGIPLFEDVLTLVDGRVPLIVELKAGARNSTLCTLAAQMLSLYHGHYCIESFHPRIVQWFCKNRPNVIRGQLSAGHKRFGSIPGWQAIILSTLVTNAVTRPHFVAYQHKDARTAPQLSLFRFIGGRLVAWTVRDTDDFTRLTKRFDAVIFEFFCP